MRQLIRTPGFSAVVILTLALGVRATTAMFSVVNGVLVRALPYQEPDCLVAVDGLGYKGEVVHLRDHAGTFDVGAYGVERPVTLTEAGDPARLTAVPATDRLFRVLVRRSFWGLQKPLASWAPAPDPTSSFLTFSFLNPMIS